VAGTGQTGMGKLVIQTTTAREALPVVGATVTVSQTGQEAGVPPTLLHSVSTDRSGRTPVFDLPAPPRAASMQTGGDKPYARYTVQVEHPDFQPVSIVDVTIFDGVVSTLPVFLVPRAEQAGRASTVEVIPPPPVE